MEVEETLEEKLERYEKRIKYLETELYAKQEYSRRLINDEIVEWLSKNINQGYMDRRQLSTNEIRAMLDNQIAVLYLLIWPIMEQHHFSGFLTYEQIDPAAEELKKYYNKELLVDLDRIIEKFFYRYNLSNRKRNPYLNRLQRFGSIDKDYEDILGYQHFSALGVKPKDKIKLLLFVIYRYRNNIFHGSKPIQDWEGYEEQIRDCLVGMMKITDCMKRHNIVIPRKDKH